MNLLYTQLKNKKMNKIFNTLCGIRQQPTKTRIWYYQFPNEDKKELRKRGKYWYFTNKGSEQGNNELRGAKGDIIVYHNDTQLRKFIQSFNL